MDQKEYEKTPKGKYIRQRANAAWRGIPWEFSFNSWWKKWQDSGKWEERGHQAGQYYMCRTGDTGPYSPENVRIDSIAGNAFEAWQLRKAAKEQPRADPFRPYQRSSAWDYPGSMPVIQQTFLKESTESA